MFKALSVSTLATVFSVSLLTACDEEISAGDPIDKQQVVDAYQQLDIQTRVSYNVDANEFPCGSKLGNGMLFMPKTLACPDGGQLIGSPYGLAGKFEYDQCALTVDDGIRISVSGDSTHNLSFGGAGTIINNFDVEVFDSSGSSPIARLEMIEQTLQSNCNLSTTRGDLSSFISLRCVEGVLCDSSWHKYVPIATEYNAFSNAREFVYVYDGETLDADHDGLLDEVDNCPSIPNASQTDDNGNDVGDVCE